MIRPELQALAEALRIAAPGLKGDGLPAQIERMLLKRGVSLVLTSEARAIGPMRVALQACLDQLEQDKHLLYAEYADCAEETEAERLARAALALADDRIDKWARRTSSVPGRAKGGLARAANMTAERRSEIAKSAAQARWSRAQ